MIKTIKTNGLTTFDLKIIALVMMLIDHIGEFIPSSPIWFRYLGRLSAPIFIFCMVWGLDYTRSRLHFICRLYIASLIMGLVEFIIIQFFNVSLLGHHNIFSTMFNISLAITLFQFIKNNSAKRIYAIIFFVIWLSTSILLPFICGASNSIYILLPLFGNIFFCEGGVIWVILGILIYFIKNKSTKLIIGYTIYCVLYALNSMIAPIARFMYYLDFHNYFENTIVWPIMNVIYNLLFQESYGLTPIEQHGLYLGDFQWMMIGALPLMLLYNNKLGRKMKWFFYFFYPIHIILLTLFSNYGF